MEADLTSGVKSEDSCISKAEEAPASIAGDDVLSKNQMDEGDDVEEMTGFLSDSSDVDNTEQDDITFADLFADIAAAADRKLWKLYLQDHNRSKGFDIDHYYPTSGIQRFPLEEMDSDSEIPVFRDFKKTVEAAVKFKNTQNNWNLELVEITKCNFVDGSLYYATFDALDSDTGVTRTYQAKVERDHFTGKTRIFRFRVKLDSSPEP